MKIISAHAIHNFVFHPMYPSSDQSSTSLVRLGSQDKDEIWTATAGDGVKEWMEEANKMLTELPEGDPHLVMEAGPDITSPADSVSKGLPWYATFWVRENVAGLREVWAGSFMPDTNSAGETNQGQRRFLLL